MIYHSFSEAINAVPATWKIFPVWGDPDDVWSGYHWEAGQRRGCLGVGYALALW